MVEGEVTLDLTFSVADEEYYFYLSTSFNITGSVQKPETTFELKNF